MTSHSGNVHGGPCKRHKGSPLYPEFADDVPDKMVECFAALLNFCYLALQSAHDNDTLALMQKSLDQFHQHRTIFEEAASVPMASCSLNIWTLHNSNQKIWLSKWSLKNVLGQMLVTNQCLEKLAVMCAVLEGCGMLKGSVLADAMLEVGLLNPQDLNEEHIRNNYSVDSDNVDVHDVEGPGVMSYVEIGKKLAYSQSMQSLANELNKPDLKFLILRFVFEQLQDAAIPHDSSNIDVDDLPSVGHRVHVYQSASATFFAPSELAGNRECIARSFAQTHTGEMRWDERPDPVMGVYGDTHIYPMIFTSLTL
ncbi:hypothetical protein GLOTRDRAFT_93794 [Gloeophyllum trabeum ATCC 11539]|uniref:Uncharacterized protein n=1 Tax=Gloeophyllum trabeum (strain ATCC 11539 / FP-39264 / Madison 617) TaxID=670483 RepID=S7RLN5_GLOTA|nr:uncharacterized protein GLOTRDRAFT_93794 [Gloeophyllum trabeum ATCC 11539]EPQ55320.1 hypothetical protein GLOTRDRAFT_93794 [Gloeophyllum trabeum ATCC 11539]